MSDRVEIYATGAVAYIGPKAVNVLRVITLAHGLRAEINGFRLTRGRTCYAIIKSEFGLKGNRGKVLAQFLPIVDKAKTQIPVVSPS